MTLLDRYLFAVRNRLPRNQRDDIVDEVASILKRFGRPITVAARYTTSGYLIGPALYPSFLISIRLLAWVLGPLAAVALLLTMLLSDHPVSQTATQFLIFVVIGLANFAIITLVFARIERMTGTQAEADDWDPRHLPSPDRPAPTPRWEAISSLVTMAFYLALWVGVMPVQSWIAGLNRWVGSSPLPYGFAPIWSVVSPILVALMLASMIRDVVSIIRPRWVMLRGYVGLVLHAGLLLVLARLVHADAIFVVTDPAGLAPSQHAIRARLIPATMPPTS